MKSLPLAFFYLSILFRLVLSLSPTYLSCQLQKPTGESALAGCPEGTLYVSSTDPSANFTGSSGGHQFSVSSAILIPRGSLMCNSPGTGKAVILIGEGQYFEMVNVTRGAPLVLLGQLDSATASTRAGNAPQRNLVYIWNNLHAGNGLNDEETPTLTVGPSDGHPFGNVDFKAYNIDFENRAANYSIAPALVTSITLANTSFYGCAFASWQDTWYAGYGSNTYVVDSTIYGQTDCKFFPSIPWFQSVTLANRGCGGGITAWRGEPGTTNGVYIANSNITRSPDIDPTIVTTGRCFLGRPWNEYAVAVFLKNHMDDSIHPSGFTSWASGDAVPTTTFYAEFDSHGPGANMSSRVEQDHILSSEESQTHRLEEVFQERPRWIDSRYQY
ncbi:carbohydrate esterase family 8 protein [Boletus reticuloceps]|uniref:pectinesterase n=1 Tax=Boletus reticuloceps TaxID=495285 RepID=A0A8I2YTQ8_9AGAM|nr:carbohydrate esterase family 8 protein [Boletus reticuloceps]